MTIFSTLDRLPIILFLGGFIIAGFFPRALAFIAPVIGLAIILSYIIQGRKKEIGSYVQKYREYFISFLALFLLAAASLFWTISYDVSSERVLKLLPMLLLGGFIPLIWVYCSETTIRNTFVFTLWLWLLGVIFMNIELLFHMPFYRTLKGLSWEEWFHPSYLNRQIAFLTLIFFILYPVLLRAKDLPFQLPLKIALPALTTTMLILTESQGSQLGFMMGVITLFLFPSWWKSAWLVLKALLVAGTLLAPWIALYAFSYAADLHQYEWFQNGYAAHRLEIWNFIALKIMENPLYGFGIEATRIIKDFDTQQLYHPSSEIMHPHNFALQFWMEFGAIGALFAAAFLWMIIHNVQNMPDQLQRSILPFFMGLMVIAATGYGMWQGWWLGFFFMAIGLFALTVRFSKDQEWINSHRVNYSTQSL